MTRTTDPDPKPFQPLGPAIKPWPKDHDPGWKQKPDAAPGIQQDRDGNLRTNLPLPKGTP
jgi:hypothetical protein